MFCKKSILEYQIYNIAIESSGEDNGNPLQYSCLENPVNGETW